MKKLMKPIVLMFVIAVSTGAYAQQDKSARPIKAELKGKQIMQVKRANVKTKALVVANRDADIQRIVRKQGGLVSAQVK